MFAVAHIPRDLVEGYLHNPLRPAILLGFAGLMSMVYLQTGNLLTTAMVHMLLNEPMLVIAGRHVDEITVTIIWTAATVVAVGQGRRHARAARRSGTSSLRRGQPTVGSVK